MWQKESGLRVYSGLCPDPECRTKLYFPSYAASSIECTGCGQYHDKGSLLEVEDVKDPDVALRNLLRSVLLGHTPSKTSSDFVKVKGFSNYHCKLLSPLLTQYGMDKHSGQAKLLKELSQGEMFDCSLLGDRSFEIELEHLDTAGYGRDKSGSVKYLKETLEAIKAANEGEERLLPVHVDGDGHCLVHALSRGLVGREIFWHALRANLKYHLETEILKYKGVFHDFIDAKEWREIISEADPYFQPPEGQGHGLRNIHIFGLANVLHRPIILLDSMSGMQSSGDYSGVFLPALIPIDDCKSRDGKLNKPLAIAWSSLGRNHFIPLVGVKTRQPPKLPQWVLPKAWGIPNELVRKYIEFDAQGHCLIGGTRSLQDKYIQRLVKAMDDVFYETRRIAASLVTEVHQYVYKPSGFVGILPETVTEAARTAVKEGRLHRCLSCNALTELNPIVSPELLQKGGQFYDAAVQTYGALQDGLEYNFPLHQGLVCVYDAEWDALVPVNHKDLSSLECHYCHGPSRRVRSNGSVVYLNGDRTSTPVIGDSRCGCGYKHYWDGREYDNLPEMFPITMEWAGSSVKETVYWFQYEPNPEANSNVYDVATKLVQKHFPGEFGSERLVQKVVDMILRQTAKKDGENKGAAPKATLASPDSADLTSEPGAAVPSKIILTGEKKKTFHREELSASTTELVIKARTEHHAVLTQKRKSKDTTKETDGASNRLTKQQGKQEIQAGASQEQSSPQRVVSGGDAPPQQAQTASRTDKKLRLSSSDGRQLKLTLSLDTTFKELQKAIEKELGIPPSLQKIRFGFPPRELLPPDEAHAEEPVPLQHGDRVTVERLKVADVSMLAEGPLSDAAGASTAEQQQALASALVNAIGALSPDQWEVAQHCPEMFDRGGWYFDYVMKELGPLQDHQHCTLSFFPNKVFAYNADKDRLDLCLGQSHIEVQPLSEEMLSQAHSSSVQQSNTQSQGSRQLGHLTSEASFSGVIVHRDSSRSRTAFSGAGRTLAGPQPKTPRTVNGEETGTQSNRQSLQSTLVTTSQASSSSERASQNTETANAATSRHQDTAQQVAPAAQAVSVSDDVEMEPGFSSSNEQRPNAQTAGASEEGKSPVRDRDGKDDGTAPVSSPQDPMETDPVHKHDPLTGTETERPEAGDAEANRTTDVSECVELKQEMEVECTKATLASESSTPVDSLETRSSPGPQSERSAVPMELDSGSKPRGTEKSLTDTCAEGSAEHSNASEEAQQVGD